MKNGFVPLILAILFAGGCVKESSGDGTCGGYNLVFFYPGNGTTDIFPSKIDHVRMLVYDFTGRLVVDRGIERESLEEYRGGGTRPSVRRLYRGMLG